jgi:hypothetical protein
MSNSCEYKKINREIFVTSLITNGDRNQIIEVKLPKKIIKVQVTDNIRLLNFSLY